MRVTAVGTFVHVVDCVTRVVFLFCFYVAVRLLRSG